MDLLDVLDCLTRIIVFSLEIAPHMILLYFKGDRSKLWSIDETGNSTQRRMFGISQER